MTDVKARQIIDFASKFGITIPSSIQGASKVKRALVNTLEKQLLERWIVIDRAALSAAIDTLDVENVKVVYIDAVNEAVSANWIRVNEDGTVTLRASKAPAEVETAAKRYSGFVYPTSSNTVLPSGATGSSSSGTVSAPVTIKAMKGLSTPPSSSPKPGFGPGSGGSGSGDDGAGGDDDEDHDEPPEELEGHDFQEMTVTARRRYFIRWMASKTREIKEGKESATLMKAMTDATTSDTVLAAFGNMYEGMDLVAGQEYLERRYHASTARSLEWRNAGANYRINPGLFIDAVSDHVAHGASMEDAILVEAIRDAIGFYQITQLKPGIKQVGEWFDAADNKHVESVKAALVALLKGKQGALVNLTSAIAEVWVLSVTYMAKTGHHYINDFAASFKKVADTLGFGSITHERIWHSAVHPIDMRALQPVAIELARIAGRMTMGTPAASKAERMIRSLHSVLTKRIRFMPAGWGWLSLVVRIFRQIMAMSYGETFNAAFGDIYRAAVALHAVVAVKPEDYGVSMGWRGSDFEALEARGAAVPPEIKKIPKWDRIPVLVPICAGWVEAYAKTAVNRAPHLKALAQAKAMDNRAGEMAGAVIEWRMAFAMAKRTPTEDLLRMAMRHSGRTDLAISDVKRVAKVVRPIQNPMAPVLLLGEDEDAENLEGEESPRADRTPPAIESGATNTSDSSTSSAAAASTTTTSK